MPSTGIEPANLRSLARRSNQLSYAATTELTVILLCRIKQLRDKLRRNGITISNAVQDIVDNITDSEYCKLELLMRDWRVVQNEMTLHHGKSYPSSVIK